jgi:DNA-binding beta-propeller fold protein YncE
VVGVRGLGLEIYDANTLKSLGRIDAGEGPSHLVTGPGDRFYVADTRGGAVLVYAARPELKQLYRVSLPGSSPYGLAIDPEHDRLWVTLTAKNRLIELDLSGGAPRKVASYPTFQQPNGVAVDSSSGRVFVAGRTEDKLQILDP